MWGGGTMEGGEPFSRGGELLLEGEISSPPPPVYETLPCVYCISHVSFCLVVKSGCLRSSNVSTSFSHPFLATSLLSLLLPCSFSPGDNNIPDTSEVLVVFLTGMGAECLQCHAS